MTSVPGFVTHYHLANRQPFLNLSDLPPEGAARMIDELTRSRLADPRIKRVFGRRYMELRELTENRLRELFKEVGGRVERPNPHYFVLGRSAWFHAMHPEMRELVLPLSALPDEVSSFTYPDSFTSMAFGPRFGLPHVARPYHERVFRLSELQSVVAKYGPPADDTEDHDGYEKRPFEKYIEVQLWSDEPIRRFLAPSS